MIYSGKNHQFSTPNKITVMSSDHQWLLKPLGEKLRHNPLINLEPTDQPGTH